MSEYIIEIPDDCFLTSDTERDMYYPDERDSAMPIIPLVRCRDCKHYTDDEMEYSRYCGSWCEQVEPNGFCSDGERTGSENCNVCRLVEHGASATLPSFRCWSCSECGFGWHHSVHDKQFSYCPNCGRRVIRE